MVAKMEEAGNALGDFGLSLVKLCKFEDDEGSALGVYTQQGAATKRISADCKRTGMVRTPPPPPSPTPSQAPPLHTSLAVDNASVSTKLMCTQPSSHTTSDSEAQDREFH